MPILSFIHAALINKAQQVLAQQNDQKYKKYPNKC